MKTIKSKKLSTQIDTICDFTATHPDRALAGTTNESDTTVTMTIIITTINTQTGYQKLTA